MESYSIPPAHVISRPRRQELQRLFELGQRITVAEPDKAAEALRRFQYCVEHDPSNRIYIEAFLQVAEATQPRPAEPGGRFGGVLRGWFDRDYKMWRSAEQGGDCETVLQHGPELLARNPWEVPVLVSMAGACHQFGYLDAALRYLQNALPAQWLDDQGAASGSASAGPVPDSLAPEVILAVRLYARTLAWTGRFATAARCWEQLAHCHGGDAEAEKWLALLETQGDDAGVPDEPGDNVDECLAAARDAADRRDFEAAHHLLAHANSLAAGYLPTQELAEDLQLEQARERIELARKLYEHEPLPATRILLEDYLANLARVELEVYHARSMRYPTQWQWRIELGDCLDRTDKTNEAIEAFSAVPADSPRGMEARLREGECRQKLRDFEGALASYRQARDLAQAAEEVDPELARRIAKRLETLETAVNSASGLDKSN